MKKYIKQDENGKLFFFENQQTDENGNSLDYPLAEVPEDYFENTDKYEFTRVIFEDISSSDEYKAKILIQQNENRKAELTRQINDLDLKRIRAGFEPSIKDKVTGETYLQYYTNQIITLRNEFNSL